MYRRTAFVRLFLLMLNCCGIAVAAQEVISNMDSSYTLSGHYLNQYSYSSTAFSSQQTYQLDLNRLRLELQGQLSRSLAFDVQYDHHVLFGSYLDTSQFKLQKQRPAAQFWQLGQNYLDTRNVYARQSLYRAYASLSSGALDLRIGRQRIAWGTGRFWSPLDLMNPIAATQLDRGERPGVDALLLERKLDALSRISVVLAPQHASVPASSALYWHGNRATMDFSVLAASVAGSRVLGGDLATQIGAAGLRAELSHTLPRNMPHKMPHFWRALGALDYAFANTLTLSAELYYDGAGARAMSDYDLPAILDGRAQNLGRRYLGVYASFEITPLLKMQHYFATNLQDGSRYMHSSLSYSLRSNLECALGAQLFAGAQASEYGRLKNLYYTQLRWFF